MGKIKITNTLKIKHLMSFKTRNEIRYIIFEKKIEND